MKSLVLLTLLFAASAFAADDLTGTWNCEVETDMGSGTPTFQLKQDGTAVTGKYAGALGEADVTGKVTGSKFEISFKFDQGSVVYSGEFSGASQTKGSVNLAGQATGKFTCKKK
jgi:hypothetical protein